MTQWNDNYRYRIDQVVRSVCDYHRGERGTVRLRQPGEKESCYTVQFAGNDCVFLRESWLEPVLPASEVKHSQG